MKKLVGVFVVTLAVVALVGFCLVTAHAGVWFAEVVVTPGTCVPIACASVVCAPAVCTVAVRPCYPTRIGFWTGPARPCGERTYNEYNTGTGTFNQIIDVGLNASGRPAAQFTNATGGWTVLKELKR